VNSSNLVVEELVKNGRTDVSCRRASTSEQLVKRLPEAARMLLISINSSRSEGRPSDAVGRCSADFDDATLVLLAS